MCVVNLVFNLIIAPFSLYIIFLTAQKILPTHAVFAIDGFKFSIPPKTTVYIYVCIWSIINVKTCSCLFIHEKQCSFLTLATIFKICGLMYVFQSFLMWLLETMSSDNILNLLFLRASTNPPKEF